MMTECLQVLLGVATIIDTARRGWLLILKYILFPAIRRFGGQGCLPTWMQFLRRMQWLFLRISP